MRNRQEYGKFFADKRLVYIPRISIRAFFFKRIAHYNQIICFFVKPADQRLLRFLQIGPYCFTAKKAGYRSIDTAQAYFNEEGVGAAVKKSGIARDELFITSKVWLEHYGYDACRAAVLESLSKLQLDYVDLMLLHQPFNDYYGAWRALEDLYDEGKIRAIGVSNFYPDRLVDICSFARICPMMNQVETHPFHQQMGTALSKICSM